ncbi:hypothetical protein FAZ98_15140 [Paraburkholderia acidisoli]|uniref:Intracellular septation protein A n=1 Tax=Paraburkholderia acidisoli TaxID=2571748 RepID=A0A7Z2JIK5_9BURK|nr:hypothetical protein FAZ98_15140 [Paraburkholderia acidisoli]
MRWVFAIVVNVALPALAYRLALPHFGVTGALVASALPLLAWMAVDLARFGHFDALSALVLAGIALSLIVLVSGVGRQWHEAREPAVSGAIGALFLLSLPLEKPLVFWLARSTLAREKQGREIDFDAMWTSRPGLARSIRLMTAVWGVGLVAENLMRLWISLQMSGEAAERLSLLLRYATYGALAGWTILYRRFYLKRSDRA